MRKLIVLSFISLDGVMQAPGGKGEDPSGGFDLEGWTVPYFDETGGAAMNEQMGQPLDLLLGRKTYDIFANFWPKQGDDNVFKHVANKYVVSHGDVEAVWDGTVVLNDDPVARIRELKQGDGPMLQVHGSGNLIQTLLANDLVDELWLKTFPVTIGKGKKLFADGTRPAAFELTKSVISPSGVIIANYTRAGDVQTGSFS